MSRARPALPCALVPLRTPIAIILIVAGAAAPAAVRAGTIVADAASGDGKAALKKAVEAAKDGDRIEVRPGLYEGPLRIAGKRVTIAGPAPAAGAAPGVRVEGATGGATVAVEEGGSAELAALDIVWRGGPTGTGLRVRGPKAGTGAGGAGAGAGAKTASVRVAGCRLGGGTARGLDAAGACDVTLEDAVVAGNAGPGIAARDGAVVRATRCELGRNGGSGAEASGAGSRLTLASCRVVENGRSGVVVGPGASVALEATVIAGNPGAGLLAQGASEAIVVGGSFRGNGDTGLRVAATKRLAVADALVTGGRTGIALLAGSSGRISGTAIVGAEGHGVVVEGAGEIAIEGSLIARNGDAGIVAREPLPRLAGTVITANAGPGLAVSGAARALAAGATGPATSPGPKLPDDALVVANGRDPAGAGPTEAAAVKADARIGAAVARLADLATALAGKAGDDADLAAVAPALKEATAAAKEMRERFRKGAGTIAVTVRDAAGVESAAAFELLGPAGEVLIAAVEGSLAVTAGEYRVRLVEEAAGPGPVREPEPVKVAVGAEAAVVVERPRTLRVRVEGAGMVVLRLKDPAAARDTPAASPRDGRGTERVAVEAARVRLKTAAPLDGPGADLAVRALARYGTADDVEVLLAMAAAKGAWPELQREAVRGLVRIARESKTAAARLGLETTRGAKSTEGVASASAIIQALPADEGVGRLRADLATAARGEDLGRAALALETLALAPEKAEAPLFAEVLRRKLAKGQEEERVPILHLALARRHAALALARLGDPVGFAWLGAGARRFERPAISTLLGLVDNPEALLAAGLASESPERRVEAALAAGEIADPARKQVGILVSAYSAEQRPGRRSLGALRAIEDALYAHASPAPVPLEAGRLAGGGKAGLAAAERLARAGHEIALPTLADWVKKRLDVPEERAQSLAVLEALGGLRSPEARAVLEGALGHKDPLVRLAAAVALARSLERAQ